MVANISKKGQVAITGMVRRYEKIVEQNFGVLHTQIVKRFESLTVVSTDSEVAAKTEKVSQLSTGRERERTCNQLLHAHVHFAEEADVTHVVFTVGHQVVVPQDVVAGSLLPL